MTREFRLLLAVCAFFMLSNAASAALDPLSADDVNALNKDRAACHALIVDGPLVLAYARSGNWVTFRTDGRIEGAPVVFRDQDQGASEVRFSATSDGESLRGSVRQLPGSASCSRAGKCMANIAQLTLTKARRDGAKTVIHDGKVTVEDFCEDKKQRFFQTTSWLEKLLRLTVGH